MCSKTWIKGICALCLPCACALPWFSVTDSQESWLLLQEGKAAGTAIILGFIRLWCHGMHKEGAAPSALNNCSQLVRLGSWEAE